MLHAVVIVEQQTHLVMEYERIFTRYTSKIFFFIKICTSPFLKEFCMARLRFVFESRTSFFQKEAVPRLAAHSFKDSSLHFQRAVLFLRYYFTPTILYFCDIFGVSKVKTSPFFLPMSAPPSGERCEILCSCILASALPTIS